MRHLIVIVAALAVASTAVAAYRPDGGVPAGLPAWPPAPTVATELETAANAWLKLNGFTTFYFAGTTCVDAATNRTLAYPHHTYDCTAIHTVTNKLTGAAGPYDHVWESFQVKVTSRVGARFKTVVGRGVSCPSTCVSTGAGTPLQPNGVWGFNLVIRAAPAS
jgi:hypothetical protein